MKRWLKLALSLLVRGWDLCRNSCCLVLGRPQPETCVVLYYHSVRAEERNAFARQMNQVLRSSAPLPAGSRQGFAPGRHHCVITFDDGFVSVIENALPELEQRKIPFTMFIPTGSIGASPSWIKDTGHRACQERVLSSNQLSLLKDCDLLTIGSHSVSHPDFLQLEPTAARTELENSKKTLEGILGRDVVLFSFPYGKYSESLFQQAEQAGYQRVFTSDPCLAKLGAFVMGRTAVDPEDLPIEFHLKLLGAYRWLSAFHDLKAALAGSGRKRGPLAAELGQDPRGSKSLPTLPLS